MYRRTGPTTCDHGYSSALPDGGSDGLHKNLMNGLVRCGLTMDRETAFAAMIRECNKKYSFFEARLAQEDNFGRLALAGTQENDFHDGITKDHARIVCKTRQAFGIETT
jgi:hypothetical protein